VLPSWKWNGSNGLQPVLSAQAQLDPAIKSQVNFKEKALPWQPSDTVDSWIVCVGGCDERQRAVASHVVDSHDSTRALRHIHIVRLRI